MPTGREWRGAGPAAVVAAGAPAVVAAAGGPSSQSRPAALCGVLVRMCLGARPRSRCATADTPAAPRVRLPTRDLFEPGIVYRSPWAKVVAFRDPGADDVIWCAQPARPPALACSGILCHGCLGVGRHGTGAASNAGAERLAAWLSVHGS